MSDGNGASPPDNLFDKAAAKKRRRKPKDIPKERQDRYLEWLQLSSMHGFSTTQIAERERSKGRKCTTTQVSRGLDWACRHLATLMGRREIIQQHHEFSQNQIAILMRETHRLLNAVEYDPATGRLLGIPVTENVDEASQATGRKKRTKKTHRSHISELTALSREMREWKKFMATLDGLMQHDEADDLPTAIEVRIPGLLENIYTQPKGEPANGHREPEVP